MKSFLTLILVFTLAGCSCEDPGTVDAVVLNKRAKKAWSQPISTGKTLILVPHPAKFLVDINDGVSLSIIL
jgi:hypothetical protein